MDFAARQLRDQRMIERCDDDLLPRSDLLQQRIDPIAALDLENHRGVRGESTEIANALRRNLGGGQGLDWPAVQLVIVKKDGDAVGEQPQISLEAVRPLPQRAFEGVDRVFPQSAWAAAVAEDREVMRITLHMRSNPFFCYSCMKLSGEQSNGQANPTRG